MRYACALLGAALLLVLLSRPSGEAVLSAAPALTGDIAVAQKDPRWQHARFGSGHWTFGQYGCFTVSLTILLRDVYRVDVTPPEVDDVLAGRAYWGSQMRWESVAPLFERIEETWREPISAWQVRDLLDSDHRIILRSPGPDHFVYLVSLEGHRVLVIDSLDGQYKYQSLWLYTDMRVARIRSPRVILSWLWGDIWPR